MKRLTTLTKHFSALACGLVLSVGAQAQLTGTISVPSTGYPTLASAITALNTQGVGTGGVTISVTAAQAAPAGGYLLGSATLNSGTNATSATRQVTINGNGNTVTAFTGTSTTTDGIFQLVGADWITIDSLHLEEKASNTTPTTRMEWGYALVKRQSSAPFDGCQNNTIRNCNITLDRLNINSAGIYGGNHIATATTNLTITAAGDANSYNTFRGNTISNSSDGIKLTGYSNAAPYSLYDQGNVVGGATMATGNTIQNFAGTTTTAYGVYGAYQNDFKVRKNTIANAAGTGGATAAGIVYGIYLLGPGSNGSVIGNNVELTNGSTSASYLIYASTSADSLAVDSNTLGIVSTSSGSMYGIYTLGTTTYLSMNANTLRNATIAGTGSMYIFYPSTTSKTGGRLTVNDNKINKLSRTSTGSTYCLYQTGSTNADTVSICRNNFSDIEVSGTFYAIYAYGGAAPYPVRIYQYDTLQTINTGTGLFYGIYTYNLSTGSDISRNYLNGITNGSTLYGIYTSSTGNTGLSLHHNRISEIENTNASSSTNYLIYTGGTDVKVYNNHITDVEAGITTSGTIYGIYVTTGNGATIYNNNISDLRAPAASIVAPIYGIYLGSGSGMGIYNNTINLNATSTGANFGATGIYYSSAIDTVDIRNNILRINVTPSGTGYTVALRRSTGTNGTPPANLAFTSNSNIYYVPTATNAWFYGEGSSATTMYNKYDLTIDPDFNTTCGLYKTFMTPRENASFTENNLVATGTLAGVFAPSGSSYAQNNGIPTSQVTNDFYGTLRGVLPDAGAVEFTDTARDAAGPVIAFTPLETLLYCSTAPAITATITDPAGVNTTTGTRPRMYFKKSTEANVFGGANTSSANGWKWVEATGTGPSFTFTINYSLLTSALAPSDSIQYFIVAQDNSATPNVTTTVAAYPSGYCPTSVALPVGAGPIGNIPVRTYGYRYPSLPAYAAAVSPGSICVTGNITLSLSDLTNGLTIQWQSAPISGGPFTNLAGKTNPTDTLMGVSSGRLYRAILSCSGVPVDTSVVDTLRLINPLLLSTTPAGRCGPGALTLNATASAGSVVNWYTAATGGASVSTGTSYTTPTLTGTTTYYASASTGGSGGSDSISAGIVVNTSGSGTGGMMFDIDAANPFTLDSVRAAFAATGMQSFDVYIRSGTHCGFQTSSTGWTLMSSSTVNGTAALGVFALATPVNIPAGLTGVYLNYNARYTSTTSCSTASVSNADMTITMGSALTSLFGSTNNRAFGGTLIYHKGCEGPRTAVAASIGTPVTPTITAAGSTDICAGDSIVISALPTAPAYTYQWSRNGTAIAGATGSQYAARLAGNYTVAVTTAPGCINTSAAATTVTIKNVPRTVTPSGPVVFCTGGQDTLSAPAGTGLSYQWLSNGAPIAGATNQTLIVTATGAYRVRVTSSVLGCSDTSIAVNVSVQATPPATVTTIGNSTICPNSNVLLSGPVVSGLLYQWKLNGTNITGATGQTYQASVAGTYTLAVDAGPNCKATSTGVTLATGALPPTTVTPPAPTALCAGGTVTLEAPTGANYNYQWLNSTGAITGATSATYTLNTAGTYRLKITNTTNGCIDTSVARSIASVPLPTVSLTPAGPATLCHTDSIKLTAVSASAVQWEWSANGSSIAGANASTYWAGTTTGLYTVRVRDANDCRSAPSNAFSLTVTPPATALITYNSQLTFCQGGAVVLNAQTEAGNKVQWLTNGTAVANDTLPYKQVMAAGTYRIRVLNSLGCTTTSNAVPVTVLPVPQPQIVLNGVILSVTNGPFAAYQWYRNNLPVPGATQPTHTVTANRGYSVQVTDDKGCEGRSETLVAGPPASVDNTAKGTIRMYPNPTSSLLYVDAPMAIGLTVRDATGRVVAALQQANTVDLSNLADGLYMVYVTDVKGHVLAIEKVTKATGK